MNFFDTQNPGIGGLKELTTTEQLTVQQIASLGTPAADRILFYDFSANSYQFLTLGTGLAITGTTIDATSGSGSVTSVSIVTANGVSGSVATATTTPAITLTLGAITPTSVVSSGTGQFTALGVGIASTVDHKVNILLGATEGIYIDASTNPRSVTSGIIKIDSTASTSGTKPIYIDQNGNGFGDTHGIAVDYTTGAVGPGTESHIYNATIDGTGATGGAVQGFSVSVANMGGLNSVYAFEANQGVSPFIQWVGTFGNASAIQYFDGTSTYTTVTTGTHQIFADATGILYFHNATAFTQINNTLSIGASVSIAPVFEYWNGSAWTAFQPVDMSNGYRESDIIKWNNVTLAGATTTTINSVANARIRIRRTAATVVTPPTETAIQISAPTSYNWNSTGDVTVHTFNASAEQTTLATFTNTGAQSTTGGAGMIGYADPGAAILSGNRLGFYLGGGAIDTAHTLVNPVGMAMFATENFSATNQGAKTVIYTTPNGSTTSARRVVATFDQDGSATFLNTVNATTFVGALTGNASTVTNGVYTTDVTTAPTASKVVQRDSSGNLYGVHVSGGFRTQATAASTLTLVLADAEFQIFTGSTASQIVKLPDVTTGATAGYNFLIDNDSTVPITIQASDASALVTLNAKESVVLTMISAGATNASWDVSVIVALDSTSTLTNKRITPRILSAASYTTDTGTSLNCDNLDSFIVTAQAGALKFNNPTGTPVETQKLVIRIKDNATARALTYDTQFRASSDLALPTTTILSKTLYMGFIYNITDTKWDLVAVLNNF